jgi:hypothetical protein
MQNITEFILGEDKTVRVEVYHVDNEEFIISSATYDLKKNNIVESTGNSTINQHILSAQIEPATKGAYTLEFIYHIGSETLKARVTVNVT